MVLSPQQVGAVWILSGGPPEATAQAIGEAYVESGFDTDAISSTGNVGLWQIGPNGDSSLKNPITNGKAAVAKFRDGGNDFTKHWHNWQGPGTAAKRAAYMPRAYRAASRVTRLNPSQLASLLAGNMIPAGFDFGDLDPRKYIPSPTNPLGPLDELFGGSGGDMPNPFGGVPILGDITEYIGNIAEVLRGFLEFVLEWSRKLADPNTWLDVGKILLGFILLTIGIRRIFTVTTS